MIQAVQWARSLDLTVLIDLHGAPGSQNGYDHSGRIGPVGFADNSTNEDRTIAVIRNLTAEFTQDIYGGAVKSELNVEIACETPSSSILRHSATQRAEVDRSDIYDGLSQAVLRRGYRNCVVGQPESGQCDDTR